MTIHNLLPSNRPDPPKVADGAFRRRWPGRLLLLVVALGITSIPFAFLMRESSLTSQFRNDGIQRLEVPLGNHSVAVLNSHSGITTRRQEGAFYVQVDRGEVLFEIKENLGLKVQAQGVFIRDLGTVFSVRVSDSQVQITLGEGEVLVSGHSFQGLVLHDRQQAVVSAGSSPDEDKPEVKSLTLQQLGSQWAWREVTPAARSDTLCDITLGVLAQKFNQRRNDQIVVVNLERLTLSVEEEGLPLDNTQAIFELLTSVDERIKVTSAEHDGHRVLTVSASPKDISVLLEKRLKNNNMCPGRTP
jgi:ferric-dicitrate binding protein FerR (iron transport regulator)